MTNLDSADFTFEGRGPHGPVEVGIERKTLPDLIASLQSGRFQGLHSEGHTGQLWRMLSTYDYSFLLVEGAWVTDRAGRLLRPGRRGQSSPMGNMTEDALRKQLFSIQLKSPMHIGYTADATATVRWLASLVRWFTDKSWEQHKTLETTYQPQSLTPISHFVQVAMTFPGVGLAAGRALQTQFDGNADTLLHAPADTIAKTLIATPAGPRALGPAKAERIRDAARKLTGDL